VVELLANDAALGGGQLDRPHKVGDGLELRADGENLVDNVLNALEALLAEAGLNNGVGADRHALAGKLHVASLVEEVLHGLKVGVTVSDEGLDKSEHVDGGGVNADENTVVDLAKSQELEDLLHLGGHTDDTSDTDDEHQLLLGGDENLTVCLGVSAVVDGSLGELKEITFTHTQLKSTLCYCVHNQIGSTYSLVLLLVGLGLGVDGLVGLDLVGGSLGGGSGGGLLQLGVTRDLLLLQLRNSTGHG